MLEKTKILPFSSVEVASVLHTEGRQFNPDRGNKKIKTMIKPSLRDNIKSHIEKGCYLIKQIGLRESFEGINNLSLSMPPMRSWRRT